MEPACPSWGACRTCLRRFPTPSSLGRHESSCGKKRGRDVDEEASARLRLAPLLDEGLEGAELESGDYGNGGFDDAYERSNHEAAPAMPVLRFG